MLRRVAGTARRSSRRRTPGPVTRVITSKCIGTKTADCVDVCPVDCIHPKKDEAGFAEAQHLFINPDECIDCGACEPACPVAAIFPDDQVPEAEKQYIQVNKDHFA
jgi:NAD-dependent dihydropyrimidine dehydrogenase PreA subunit